MGAPRPHLQDVVLLDPDDAALPAPARTGGGAPRLRRVRRWWPAGAALTLVVAAAAVVADRREDAHLAALAEVPGILAPLDGPITELWRSDEARYSDLTEVGGRLLGVRNRPDGSVDITALDPRTGTALWRAGARPPGALDTWARCASPDEPLPADEPLPTDQVSPRAVVVCVVVDEVGTHENAAGLWPYAIRSRLLVLDAATGAVLADEPAAPSTSVAAIGADLVVSHVDSGGRAHVTRTDARATTDRWTFTSPGPVPEAASGRPEVRVTVVDGRVVVDAGPGWVLAGDGKVIDSWTTDPPRHWVAARGEPAGAMPDDGSLPSLTLTETPGGESIAGRLAVIDGRVIRAEADELRSIDGRTGALVWATPVGRLAGSQLFSDGRLVLRTQAAPGRGVVFAAYGLDDGRLRWELDIADDLRLFSINGRLYGRSGQGLVALG